MNKTVAKRLDFLFPDFTLKDRVRYQDKPHIVMINNYWYLILRGSMMASSADLRDWSFQGDEEYE